MKLTIIIVGLLLFCYMIVGAGAECYGSFNTTITWVVPTAEAIDLYNFTKATTNVTFIKVEGYENFSSNMSWDNFTAMIKAPYYNVAGNIFFFLVLGIPLFMLWIRQESVIMPVIIGFIMGIAGWNYLPVEYHAVSVLFLGLSITGILFGIFKALR